MSAGEVNGDLILANDDIRGGVLAQDGVLVDYVAAVGLQGETSDAITERAAFSFHL